MYDFTVLEIGRALSLLKNGSSPGLDGLTTSFMTFFWTKVKMMVVNSLQSAFRVGELSDTQKRAVITLIHKGKDLPRDSLKNWRPYNL